MTRAFIALELSNDIKDQLAIAQQTLRGCKARLTFVDPELIHITVKFLGEVNDKKLQEVMDALARIVFLPYPITTGSITVNNKNRPHTVWCTMQDTGESERLFVLIEDMLAPLGFARETRSFTPHATIARVKSFDPSLFTALGALNAASYGSCRIHSMKLKKSTLLPQGPVYEDLLEVKW
jgi:RNA 2',3'-cyclic 3'-phosphodiesterase